MFRFGILRFLTIGLISAFAIATISRANSQPTNLPEGIEACIPTATRVPIERVELLSQTAAQERQYFLFSAYPSNETPAVDLVISVRNGACKTEFYNEPGDSVSLTSLLGAEVAQKLALGRYEREIKKYGRTKLQEMIDRAAKSPKALFYPEEVWALRRLGLQVPSIIRISE